MAFEVFYKDYHYDYLTDTLSWQTNGTTQTFVIDTITDDTHLTTTENVATLFDNDNFYLGPLSLCDATYNNSKDANISNPVRGLALNSYKGRLLAKLLLKKDGNHHVINDG